MDGDGGGDEEDEADEEEEEDGGKPVWSSRPIPPVPC